MYNKTKRFIIRYMPASGEEWVGAILLGAIIISAAAAFLAGIVMTILQICALSKYVFG